MSDEQESGQSVNSDQGSGQAQGSEQPGVQQTSQQAPPFSPEQEAWLSEKIRREYQSKDDRATAKVEKTLAQQQSEIQRIHDMVKRGMTPDQIEDRLFLDSIKAERQQGTSQGNPTVVQVASTNANGQQAAGQVDYLGIYSALGLDAGDNEVIRLTQQHPNPDKLTVELVKLKQRRAQAPPPSVGSVAASGGGGLPDSWSKLDALSQEVAAMEINPLANMKLLEQKRGEMEKLRATLK